MIRFNQIFKSAEQILNIINEYSHKTSLKVLKRADFVIKTQNIDKIANHIATSETIFMFYQLQTEILIVKKVIAADDSFIKTERFAISNRDVFKIIEGNHHLF